MQMRGPLGLRRTATTRVLAAEAPHLVVGTAQVGHMTRAFVRWKLSWSNGATRVRLEATIHQAGLLDWLLLVLGGRAWLKRRFGAVLERLAERFSHDAGERAEPGPGRLPVDASHHGA